MAGDDQHVVGLRYKLRKAGQFGMKLAIIFRTREVRENTPEQGIGWL